MFTMFKKIFLASLLVLTVLITNVWQSNQVVFAKSQNTNAPESPLYPGLTWVDLGSSTRDIRINIQGDSISLSGAGHAAVEQFASNIPPAVVSYYSNEQLAKSGWVSYDSFNDSDGAHYVFYHDSGAYLSVEFLKCPNAPANACITVWKSIPANSVAVTTTKAAEPKPLTTTGTFGKISPADGATNVNPDSVVLSWGAYSPAPDKYSYCVKEGSACDASDPNWTSTYNLTATVTGLAYGKTYDWQIKAITCVSCVPKKYVYANGGTVWTFKTKPVAQAVILGNAGVAGATLSYTNGTLKTVTADGSGNYSISVPLNWSGTITPAKTGYMFSPKNASFSNLTAPQTIQNFTAITAYTISGNTSIAGVTLSYTDGTPQTVISDGSGNYSIIIPSNWSGTVTPSKTGYTFSPVNKNYSSVIANQTLQNYSAFVSISGNVGVASATLGYTDGTLKTVTADGTGIYSITVPYGWTGVVTPYKNGYTFTSISRSYGNIQSSQTAQDYTAQACASCANVSVSIAGTQLRQYTLAASQSARDVYPLDAGPVKVESTNVVPIIAALRDAWLVNGQIQSFAQMMGLPKEQLSDTYWFPAYNNLTLSEQIRFANVDTVATTVTVNIGGVDRGTYPLAAGASQRVTYALDAGPVKVSSTGQKIIASIRDAWLVNNNITSFTELMGLPKESLSDTYLFPAYNNMTLSGQLRFANVDSVSTNVTVTIDGVPQGSYPLSAGQSQRVTYNVDSGPVEIKSNNGAKLIAALRDAWLVNGQITSFSQLMGMPKEKLSDTYWFPAYNNMTLSGQLRFANVDTVATDVTVTIGGVAQNGGVAYHLDSGTSQRVTYPLDAGPVKIASTGQKIIAALRDAWSVNGSITSFVQMMGLPKEALSTTYWFPGYNNLTLSGQLRFAVP